MHIEYKILWLDDQIESFIEDEYVDEIKKYIEDQGFKAIIDPVDNATDFFQKLDNSYDLILTDYHMESMNGDRVVEYIRNTSRIFSEILFYTAKADLKDICKIDRVSFLQTDAKGDIHEKAVIEKIKNLISLTIEKFHDIVIMRGMIMNETSDFDNEKKALLKTFIELKKYQDDLPKIKKRLFEEIDSFLNQKNDLMAKCIKNDNLNRLIQDNVLFSADKKISAISEILQIIGLEDFSDDYKKEIINIRNDFAHATLEEEKDATGKVIRKYFKKGDITFDKEYCITIRANIIKHKENLKNLKETLT